MKKGEVRKIIRDSMGLDEENAIEEAYFAQPKIYDLHTDLLLSKTKDSHEELYHGYVDKLNDVSAKLDVVDRRESDSNCSMYRSLKVDEQYNMNAVYLHELYFSNISDPYSEINYDSYAHMRLTRDFGTFNDWQEDFIACAKSCRNGWAITGLSTYLKRYINIIVDGHDCHIPVGFYPVIVLDCFEHARRDYLNNKHDYIAAMMKELNWNLIERRFQRADMILKVLE